MKPLEKPAVICIHHRLAGYSSHHYNEACGFRRDFARRGQSFTLLANVHAPASIVTELDARPLFDDPTFRLEWSFEERSQRFVDLLHRHVDPLWRNDDWVLLTVSTQLEAHALVRWLQTQPQGRGKPWIALLFLSDRWNRSGRDEYQRQIAEFEQLKGAIASLSREESTRVIFFTLTDLLAEELTALLGTHVEVAPMPLDYGDPNDYSPPNADRGVRRVALLGGTRGEKGSNLIPDIVRAARARAPVEFLVHLTNNTLSTEEAERLATLADEPDVRVIREAMTLTDYEAALGGSDIALFPYECIPYLKRTSGVFGEAVAFGKPVVVTPGTWLAEQIQAGRAAGIISEDRHPESIARAVARCVAELDRLRPLALSLSDAWREKISLPAFVDLIEATIAFRSRKEKARRWQFWKRRAQEKPRRTGDLWK